MKVKPGYVKMKIKAGMKKKYNYGDNAVTRSSMGLAGRAMKISDKVGMKKR